MTQSVTLPLAVVVDPRALPPRCVRHGEPATARRPVVLVSGTSLGTQVAQLAVALTGFVLIPGVRKVRSPAWPFCDRCRRDHARRLPVGWAVGIGVPALVVLLAVVTGGAVPPFVVLLGGLGGIFAGLLVGGSVTWAGLAGGEVTRDGSAVVLARAAPAFVAALD